MEKPKLINHFTHNGRIYSLEKSEAGIYYIKINGKNMKAFVNQRIAIDTFDRLKKIKKV